MQCPVCYNKKLLVKDSRTNSHAEIKRTRECTECLTRFSTMEHIQFGSLPDYIRDRILDGLD